ncbi:MAG TPA: hypothetical protein VIR78_04605, partial [Malonomonas sp.]
SNSPVLFLKFCILGLFNLLEPLQALYYICYLVFKDQLSAPPKRGDKRRDYPINPSLSIPFFAFFYFLRRSKQPTLGAVLSNGGQLYAITLEPSILFLENHVFFQAQPLSYQSSVLYHFVK